MYSGLLDNYINNAANQGENTQVIERIRSRKKQNTRIQTDSLSCYQQYFMTDASRWPDNHLRYKPRKELCLTLQELIINIIFQF